MSIKYLAHCDDKCVAPISINVSETLSENKRQKRSAVFKTRSSTK
jgi:hypothetical protein